MVQKVLDIVTDEWGNNDNFLIKYSEEEKVDRQNLCAIYFSSNAVWFPDTISGFEKNILQKNRFEWYGSRIKGAYKHIFVRDVFKQWYIRGINKDVCNQEKLYEWLKNHTEGYNVITIGSSAGGYAACLFGTLLNADRILAFSPQFTLRQENGDMISDIYLPDFLTYKKKGVLLCKEIRGGINLLIFKVLQHIMKE